MTQARTQTDWPATGAVIINVDHVTKSFTTPDGQPFTTLNDVSLELREGELVALLGRSGCGKSTLLRCIAGLIAPSEGTVRYRGTPLNGANPGVAMVFQSFALLPWLTVQGNVEMGLEARDVPPAERTERALKMIDVIGLDGFEQAYPKELSGGMRQRVGFARALVVEPDALLMDEPFSALDVLSAENLRTELLKLWGEKDFPTKSILIVTHNIEEAVLMADRIVVLASNPGRVRTEIAIDLPRPRDRRSADFEQLLDSIYKIMTGHDDRSEGQTAPITEPGQATPIELPLPLASVGGLAGLMEILAARGGTADLPELAKDLTFEVDDLLPLVDAAEMLGFAEVADADLQLTAGGRAWVEATIAASKELFAAAARRRAPLVRAIVRALQRTADGNLNERFFLDLLGRAFTEDDARAQLNVAIDWGRYGELFEYDADDAELILTTGEESE